MKIEGIHAISVSNVLPPPPHMVSRTGASGERRVAGRLRMVFVVWLENAGSRAASPQDMNIIDITG